MSKDGAATGLMDEYLPALAKLSAEGLSIPIIASLWHPQIMDALIAGAQRAADHARTFLPVDTPLIRVPGSFELPVAAARLAGEHDALVSIGVVIRGDTPHFEYVCQAATAGLTQVAVSTGTPVGFGVLTVDNETQAVARAGGPGASEDKGYEAFEAAIVTLASLGLGKSSQAPLTLKA
ncbi:6,7-dimethyl-8-ribityllumazine synthase [Haematomicrobium sanguinis]|uniref:6,7-dimethyl-8-ribityllumazine synthase n=1 Tax=Haematomicrobium sanguinis TaxID=479106 RepID=UPI0009495A6F|nr:6,7-dimethyl-8-ribityllumazine synthase [Haematomicrobium sanguinis]